MTAVEKLRASVTTLLENESCACVGAGNRTPVEGCKFCGGTGALHSDESRCARAALALVEEYEWHVATARNHREVVAAASTNAILVDAIKEAHRHDGEAARLLAIIEKAVQG